MRILLGMAFFLLLSSCDRTKAFFSDQEDGLAQTVFTNVKSSTKELGLVVKIVTQDSEIISVDKNNKNPIPFGLKDEITLFKDQEPYKIDPNKKPKTFPKVIIQDVVCSVNEGYERDGLKRAWSGQDRLIAYQSPISIHEIIPYEVYKEFYSDNLSCRFDILLYQGKKIKKYSFTKQAIKDFSGVANLKLKDVNNQSISSIDEFELEDLSQIYLIDQSQSRENVSYELFCEGEKVYEDEKEETQLLISPILKAFLLTDKRLQGFKNCRLLLVDLKASSSKTVKAISSIFSVNFENPIIKEQELKRYANIDDFPANFYIVDDPNTYNNPLVLEHQKNEKPVHYITSWFGFELDENLNYKFMSLKVKTSCIIINQGGSVKRTASGSYEVPIRYQLPFMMITPKKLLMKGVVPHGYDGVGAIYPNSVTYPEHWIKENGASFNCTYQMKVVDNRVTPKKEKELSEQKVVLFWAPNGYGVKEDFQEDYRVYFREGVTIEPIFSDRIVNHQYVYTTKKDKLDSIGLLCIPLATTIKKTHEILFEYEEGEVVNLDEIFFHWEVMEDYKGYHWDLNSLPAYRPEDEYERVKGTDKYSGCRIVFYANGLVRYFSREFTFLY